MSLEEWLKEYEKIAWYEDGFKISHTYSENVLIKENTLLFIPARINLKATIESERGIQVHEHPWMMSPSREVPPLFWNENLVHSNKNTYVFKTNYYTNDEEILSISCLDKIPKKLTKKFLKKVPKGISELSDKLVGSTEKDITKILKKFYEFTKEHEKSKSPTPKKSIKELLSEYKKDGFFYGSCKEARDFFSALCNSKGLPTKKVLGKSLQPLAHVWVDVFVPVKKSYKLFPVDAALGFFGTLSPLDHLFFEYGPLTSTLIKKKKYKLKIERM